MKKIALLLCLILVAVGLFACTEADQPKDTVGETSAVEAPTETPTEAPTEAPSETQTEAPTEETTEPETEAETILDTGYPVDKMTIGGVDLHSFTLVVQDGGYACVRTAADDLIFYMKKATGYAIPEDASDYEIVIGVTDRDTAAVQEARAKVENDGYTLLMDGNRLYITGSCDRGTMYGVYSFLEDYLGVRFLAPDCTVVRDNPVVEIASDVYTLHNPTFIYRDTYWYDMSLSQRWSNRSKDNAPKNNVSVPEIGGGYTYAGGAGGLGHTILYLAGQSHQVNKQLCMTDESVYQAVLAGVRKWLAQSPNAKFISVSQSDGHRSLASDTAEIYRGLACASRAYKR